MRDASFLDHPNVHSFKVIHASNASWFAVCDPRRIMLDNVNGWEASEVPETWRCRRAACAAAYRDADAAAVMKEGPEGDA
jgi:hypothetical protein